MLPRLKKKPEAAVVVTTPAWHPNFRNVERLPDTKPVRTAFFVNGIAILVAVLVALWFGYQKYQIYDLKRQVDEQLSHIDRDKRSSDQAIGLFKKYQAEAARFAEIEAFTKARPELSPLLLRLGQTLPHNVAVDSFELTGVGVRLLVTVRGAPDQASGYASTYLDQLRADAELKATFDEITLVNLSRDRQTGRLSVEYYLKLKGAAEKKP